MKGFMKMMLLLMSLVLMISGCSDKQEEDVENLVKDGILLAEPGHTEEELIKTVADVAELIQGSTEEKSQKPQEEPGD